MSVETGKANAYQTSIQAKMSYFKADKLVIKLYIYFLFNVDAFYFFFVPDCSG